MLFQPCFSQKEKDEPISLADDLSFVWKNSGDTLKLVAENKLLTAIQIYFYRRNESEEVSSHLLPPKDSLQVLSYSGPLSDSAYKVTLNDSIRVAYYLGHPELSKPDLDYQYRLPFQVGKKYELSQGWRGKKSHNNTHSMYAFDFLLDVGEPVFAAREGTVVKVIDWFSKQGGRELIKAANKIVIMHEDGTFGTYVHLEYQGSLVEVGEWVEKGQKIGLSGLTGFTNGPHLHFVVRKDNDIAIPIYFEGYNGKELKPGRRYKVKKK